MATAYGMLIRCQRLWNNHGTSAFPKKSTDKAEQCNTPGLPWLLWLQSHQRKYNFILGAVGSEIWLHWQKMHTQKREGNLVREKANGLCHVLSWEQLAATCPVSKSKTGWFYYDQVGMRPSILGQYPSPHLLHS